MSTFLALATARELTQYSGLALNTHWDWMRKSFTDPRELVAVHIPELRRRTERHRQKWYRAAEGRSEQRIASGPVVWSDQLVENQTSIGESRYLDWLSTERNLAVEQYTVDHCHNPDEIEDGLSRCLAVILDTVVGVEELFNMGILRYLQDTTSLVLSKATGFLRQVSMTEAVYAVDHY